MFDCRGFRVWSFGKGACFGPRRKTDASISGPGGRKGKAGRNRSALRAGRERAGPAKQKRVPDRTRQDRRSKSVPRAGSGGFGGIGRNRQIRADSSCAGPSGLFHAADQPQGVSAAASPRRRRRTRRSGTPRGPAPSGRGSRRRWLRYRVRPAGRRFGRRFRPDCAAAAARRPAA